jgi:hypothetical protein
MARHAPTSGCACRAIAHEATTCCCMRVDGSYMYITYMYNIIAVNAHVIELPSTRHERWRDMRIDGRHMYIEYK